MHAPRRLLVVGNGARECALANALLRSDEPELLIITPPNLGVLDARRPEASRAVGLDIAATDIPALVELARENSIELCVIGPEAPLCAGLADELRAVGVPTVGPGAETAQLEGSKAYAKVYMHDCGIPTADFAAFDNLDNLTSYLEKYGHEPCVIKADGLAAGKGVFVCDSREQGLAAAQALFAEKPQWVLVEERLSGREISFTCLLAGGEAIVLPPSSDYKRLRDGDAGPNTGGMGNMAPTPYATEAVLEEFQQRILEPLLAGLQRRELDYRGFLFVGTMITERGLLAIEFNVRFGDPEAAVVLPLLEADWPTVLAQVARGELPGPDAILQRDGAAVAVVLASGNYPYGRSEPTVVEGLDRVAARGLLLDDGDLGDVQLLHAGTSAGPDGAVLATGGRVLTVSARGADLSLARRLAYETVGNLRFDGMQFRSDVAKNPGDWPA